MSAFRMTIELAGMADIESIEGLNPDTDDDSVELIIKHDGDQIYHEETDFETARQTLEKLERAHVTNHEALDNYEFSGE